VQPDLSYQILDIDDFQENAVLYDYPTHVRTNAELAVEELIKLIETKTFPFSSF
jgi:protein associated with RNAse G/E